MDTRNTVRRYAIRISIVSSFAALAGAIMEGISWDPWFMALFAVGTGGMIAGLVVAIAARPIAAGSGEGGVFPSEPRSET